MVSPRGRWTPVTGRRAHSPCQLIACEQEALAFSRALRSRAFLSLLNPVLRFVNMGEIIQFYVFLNFNYLSMSSCIVSKLEQHNNISLYFYNNFRSLLIAWLCCAGACYCTNAVIGGLEKLHYWLLGQRCVHFYIKNHCQFGLWKFCANLHSHQLL